MKPDPRAVQTRLGANAEAVVLAVVANWIYSNGLGKEFDSILLRVDGEDFSHDAREGSRIVQHECGEVQVARWTVECSAP